MSRTITKCLQIAAVLVAMAAASAAAGASGIQKKDSLKNRIEYGLDTSSLLRKYDLKVRVDGAEVILSGDVAKEDHKTEAERIAKIAGATRIQNAIAVDPNTDKTLAERIHSGLAKTGEKITDEWITTKVQWFFVGENLLDGSDIKVDVSDRTVTLKGSVKSSAARSRAVVLATDTEGVKRVIDKLTIDR